MCAIRHQNKAAGFRFCGICLKIASNQPALPGNGLTVKADITVGVIRTTGFYSMSVFVAFFSNSESNIRIMGAMHKNVPIHMYPLL